jgi:hypothetical protein
MCLLRGRGTLALSRETAAVSTNAVPAIQSQHGLHIIFECDIKEGAQPNASS